MEKITLHTSITINGKQVEELTYDMNAITVAQFAEAESRKLSTSTQKGRAGAFELDYTLHLYLGMMAVIAVNPEIDITDLERITGSDIMKLMKIGRNFILGRSEEPSGESSFGEPCETTPELSTPPSGTSKANA